MWLRSRVPRAHHGHDLAASSSPADVHRSYFRTVFTLVLVKRPVRRLLLGFRRWSRWHFPIKRVTTARLLLLLLRLLSKKLIRTVRRLVLNLRRPFSRALGRGSVERAARQYVRGASLYGAVMGGRRSGQGPVPHRGQWFGALVQRQHRATIRGGPQPQIVVHRLQSVRGRGGGPAAPAGRSRPPRYRHVAVAGHHGRDRGARDPVRGYATVVRQRLECGRILVRGRAERGRGGRLTRKTRVVRRRGRLASWRCAPAPGEGQQIGRILAIASASSAA